MKVLNFKTTAVVIMAALTLGSTLALAQADTPDLRTLEQQIGFQTKAIMQERLLLKEAIKNRNTQVNLPADFINTLSTGVSSGFLTYDFLKGTNNLYQVRSYLVSRGAGKLAPPATASELGTTTASATESSVNTAARVSSSDAKVLNLIKVKSLKNAGEIAFRTTEIASAALLGAFFVVDVIQTGKDLTLRYSDSNEMRDHEAKLAEAQKNLDVTQANLQVALLAQQMQ